MFSTLHETAALGGEGGGGGMFSNNFILGGLLLIVVQSLSRLLEAGGSIIFTYLFRLVFVTCDVDNSQDSYVWLNSYLAHLNEQRKLVTWGTMTVVNDLTTKSLRDYYKNSEEIKSAKVKSDIMFIPGTGIHILKYSWFRYVLVHKTVAEVGSQANSGPTKEVLWLGTLGMSENFFRDLIEEARNFAYKSDQESTVIYVQENYYRTNWVKALAKTKRAWESVILDSSIAEDIYNECISFLKAREWYASLGVPYRRSFLLESPPGCGKSSFVLALAGRLGFDIAFLSLASEDLSDSILAAQLRNTPQNTIILLEDLDAAFPDRARMTREERKKLKNRQLTMSGLLNALDGLVAPEGRLLFFSTNHIEKLDAALLRPGRVDRVITLKLASHNQIERLFLKFHPDLKSVAKLYARSIPEFFLSMAQVQNHLLSFRNRAVDAVSDVPTFLASVRAAQKRREAYEKKLRAIEMAADKKKKEGGGGGGDNDDDDVVVSDGEGEELADADGAEANSVAESVPGKGKEEEEEEEGEKKEKEVASVVAKKENGTKSAAKASDLIGLAHSVHGLDNASLEATVSAGPNVTAIGGKKNKKKKKAGQKDNVATSVVQRNPYQDLSKSN